MQRQSSGYLPPPRGIPDPDPLKKQMQQDALYFEKHRNEGRKPLDSESKAYKGIVLPKPGEFPGLRAHNKSRRHHAYWWGPNPLGVGFEKNKYEAKFARIRLDNQLSTPRTVLMKTLGWGGNGIACLVRHEHNTPNGPEQEYFVVKCNINPSHHALEGLRKEKKTQAVSNSCPMTSRPRRLQTGTTANRTILEIPRGSARHPAQTCGNRSESTSQSSSQQHDVSGVCRSRRPGQVVLLSQRRPHEPAGAAEAATRSHPQSHLVADVPMP